MGVNNTILLSLQLLWLVVRMLFLSFAGFLSFCVPNVFRCKKDVSNEVVLVTGGGCGLGRLFALEFTMRGATVVIWDVNEKGAQSVADECKALGGQAFAYRVDVSNNECVYKHAEEVRRTVGDVTILVNNAGVVNGKKLLETPDHLLHRTMDVNLKAAFWLYKSFLPSMLENNHGHIVTVASVAGFLGVPSATDYCSSKAALCGLEESVYNELKFNEKSGVHSTIIHPYFMSTGMFSGTQIAVPDILPMLTPEQVLHESMEAILTNQRFVYVPGWFFRPVQILRSILPDVAMIEAQTFFGFDTQMDHFVGRGT